jgi:hypothetical protein
MIAILARQNPAPAKSSGQAFGIDERRQVIFIKYLKTVGGEREFRVKVRGGRGEP